MGTVIYSLFNLILLPLALLVFYKKIRHINFSLEEGISILIIAPFILPVILSFIFLLSLPINLYFIIYILAFVCTSWLIINKDFFFYNLKDFYIHLKNNIKLLKPNNVFEAVLFLILTGLFVVFIAQLFFIPMMEPDALEYKAVAKAIFNRGNLSNYPFLNAEDSGLFAPSSHPPGFIFLHILSFVFAGTETTLPLRLSSLYIIALTALMLVCLLKHRSRQARILALILFFASPLWVSMAASLNSDGIRICLFFNSVIFIYFFLRERNINNPPLMILGVLSGLAAFTHSIGILAPFIVTIVVVFAQNFSNRYKLKIISVLTLCLFTITGLFYLKNIILYGTPLQDSGVITELPFLEYSKEVNQRRGIATLLEAFTNGIIAPFYIFFLFGISYLVAVFSFFLVHKKEKLLSFSLIIIMIFYLILILSVLAGTTLAIKNPRYALTLFPFTIIPTSLMYDFLKGHFLKLAILALIGFSIFLSLLGSASRLLGYSSLGAVLNEKEYEILNKDRLIGGTLIKILNENMKAEERVLTFRHHEMSVYAKFKWLDHLDAALIPFYKAKNSEEAYQFLKKNNVNSIFMPHYFPATASNSLATALINDPRLTTLLGEHRQARLYKLNEIPLKFECIPKNFSQLSHKRTVSIMDYIAYFTGVPQFSKLTSSPNTYVIENTPLIWNKEERVSSEFKLTDEGLDKSLQLTLLLKGEGHISLFEKTKDNQSHLIWEGIANNNARELSMLLRSSQNTLFMESLALSRGNIRLEVTSACLLEAQ